MRMSSSSRERSGSPDSWLPECMLLKSEIGHCTRHADSPLSDRKRSKQLKRAENAQIVYAVNSFKIPRRRRSR